MDIIDDDKYIYIFKEDIVKIFDSSSHKNQSNDLMRRKVISDTNKFIVLGCLMLTILNYTSLFCLDILLRLLVL